MHELRTFIIYIERSYNFKKVSYTVPILRANSDANCKENEITRNIKGMRNENISGKEYVGHVGNLFFISSMWL